MPLRVQIDQKLERKFRELAMKKFGYTKGALSKAAEEAFIQWTSTLGEEKLSFEEDPIEAIDGLLSDIDINSVELQHEATKIWALKVLKNVSS
ncbi:hypothetical protein KAU88_06160 [Candidatus Bathyarchaeota archaeon]|nr:hypothetical protein [Candidatus Bathyarchaeota archaeon]